jgi:hypothetical protein
MRRLLYILAGIGAVLGMGLAILYGFFFFALYENDEISPRSPASFALIPAPMRSIEPVAQCAPLYHMRSFQECGGICGQYVGVSFGTTLDLETLRARFPLTPYLAATGYDEGVVLLMENYPGDPENCARALIQIYDDYSVPDR